MARTSNPIFALAFVLMAVSPALEASEASHQLVNKGAELLEEQDYVEAIFNFDEALTQDQADHQAAFFRAAALNRLGRHKEALKDLQKAEKMGSKHPDLAFEKGWAYLHLKQWKQAIDQLVRYEKSKPGRGLTSEFLGRAYYRTGQFKKAKLHLQKAIERDSDLRDTAELYLVLANAKLIPPKKSK
jgi:tetratricopeptide (TPR) repeat protein